jgi:hypothetical protein
MSNTELKEYELNKEGREKYLATRSGDAHALEKLSNMAKASRRPEGEEEAAAWLEAKELVDDLCGDGINASHVIFSASEAHYFTALQQGIDKAEERTANRA